MNGNMRKKNYKINKKKLENKNDLKISRRATKLATTQKFYWVHKNKGTRIRKMLNLK
jgi:hypothetical protein